jgi:hypothetical protein
MIVKLFSLTITVSNFNIHFSFPSLCWYLESIFNRYAAKSSGLELLLDLLQSKNQKQKGEASAALHAMASKGAGASILDPAPTSPTPQVFFI